jgi:hypothetical protein
MFSGLIRLAPGEGLLGVDEAIEQKSGMKHRY